MFTVIRSTFSLMVLSFLLPACLLAQGSPQYRFSGVYTWGTIITMLCDGGWCRTSLPRDFYTLEVPVSIYENTFDDAFRALSMQARADGYVLTKTGKKKPYEVSARRLEEKTSVYISCQDSSVKEVPEKHLKTFMQADSLKCRGLSLRDTVTRDSVRIIPLDRYRINFFVVSSSFLDDYGVDWTQMWAKGTLWSTPEFFSDWAFRAVSAGDTLSEFRTIEIDIDSAASLHWGSQLKEEKSTYQTGETVRTDYEYHNYGLTLDLTRSEKGGIRGKYSLAQRDDVNSIIEGNFGGGGGDSVSTFGVFDSYQERVTGVPFLSSIPFLRVLFSTVVRDKVKSFFVIQIVQLKKVVENPSQFDVLDSLRMEELSYAVPDTTQDQLDTLDNIQGKEVVDEEPD